MSTEFKDHFSGHSCAYGRFRPGYPPALFAYLARLAPSCERAWDCATGNGQAALGLAAHFQEVIATDASASQIAHAQAHARVVYRAALAEDSGLPPSHVDLVTVAQALHWLDLERFYREARRVLRPHGVITTWAYARVTIDPEVDAWVEELYSGIVGPYWPQERRMVEAAYAGLPFPFTELVPPRFEMRAEWTLERLLGYLRTWSAVQRFLKDRGQDPVRCVENGLRHAWGDPEAVRELRWPLALRVGIAQA